MLRPNFLLVGILACMSVFSLLYAISQRSEANAVQSSRIQLEATLSTARAQIQALSSRIDALTAAAANPPAPSLPEGPPARPRIVSPRRALRQPGGRPRSTEDPRWKRVESQLAQHRSQLAGQDERITQTQEDLRKTGDQLDGRINTARSELNQSIAANHSDVVLLQKRGERDSYEFDLTRSKQFQRVGPLSLALRKADAKHRRYDLSIMVDDKPLDKQHVNLSEPVWISLAGLSQPVQLVVTQIDKDRVHGSISAPHYKTADLTATPAPDPAHPALKSR